jgi:hypothetical protein
MYLVSLAKYVIWSVRNLIKHNHKKDVTRNTVSMFFLSLLKTRILADHLRLSKAVFAKYWLSSRIFCHLDGQAVVCNFM